MFFFKIRRFGSQGLYQILDYELEFSIIFGLTAAEGREGRWGSSGSDMERRQARGVFLFLLEL
jgi:hypothetical protein